MKRVLAVMTLVIYLVVFITIATNLFAIVVEDRLYGSTCVCAGPQFSETYDEQEQSYELEIVRASEGTAEKLYATDPNREHKYGEIHEVGHSIVIDDLNKGDEIMLIGSFSDGSEQVIQTYTVAE